MASQAVVIATGVSADGRREVLGCAVGDSETQDFWTEFLRGLRERGLGGVQLVISDHHRGLMNAIDATMTGAAWQRWVHFMRNVLSKVPKGHSDMVAAAIRTIFAQPTGKLVREQVEVVALMLQAQLPAVAAMLRDAKEEITAFADFPEAHWRKIWSTNLGAPEQGGQAPHRCRRDLPEPRRPAPVGRLCADRVPRRMAGRRTPLPLRGVHGQAEPASTHRPRDHAEHHRGGDRHTRSPDRIVWVLPQRIARKIYTTPARSRYSCARSVNWPTRSGAAVAACLAAWWETWAWECSTRRRLIALAGGPGQPACCVAPGPRPRRPAAPTPR